MNFLRNGKVRDMVPCLICGVGQSSNTREIHMNECAKIFFIGKTSFKKFIEREEPTNIGKVVRSFFVCIQMLSLFCYEK